MRRLVGWIMTLHVTGVTLRHLLQKGFPLQSFPKGMFFRSEDLSVRQLSLLRGRVGWGV